VLGLNQLADPAAGLPPAVWDAAHAATVAAEPEPEIPDRVHSLVEARRLARARRDWPEADRLRGEIARLGWQVNDLPGGAEILPIASPRP
jgi:cysteinyl-tRNA synthetase